MASYSHEMRIRDIEAENDLTNLRRRVDNARKFPTNTCAASRHLHLMAEALAKGEKYLMFDEESQYCAETMLTILESLFKARTELAKLKTPNVQFSSGMTDDGKSAAGSPSAATEG